MKFNGSPDTSSGIKHPNAFYPLSYFYFPILFFLRRAPVPTSLDLNEEIMWPFWIPR